MSRCTTGPLLAALAAALLLLSSACAPPPIKGDPQLPYPLASPPRIGDILHLPTGILVSEKEMLAAAADSRIVYVGETHDNPASHRLQLEILSALNRRYPGRTALAMEMLTPSRQPTLDAWVSGELSEKAFERAWYGSWSMDLGYYRDLLAFARQEKIPVLGINAEKSLVQAVGRKGWDELSPEERQALPREIEEDPYQQALTRAIFGGHGNNDEKRFAGFQRIQTLWDEAMAENIVRFLASPQGEDFHLLVIAGGNHVRNGFGIPRRAFRRLPVSYLLIGNEELEVSAEKQESAYMKVKPPDFPMPPYDYVVFTRYEELPAQGVKLGVLLEEVEGRVVIKGVNPGSVAASAGLLAGDRLLALDGERLAEIFDLTYALRRKAGGAKARLTFEREGAAREIEIEFPVVASEPQRTM